MSNDGSQVRPGTVVDGYTIGASVRSRVGAETYEATDAAGSAVHFVAYEARCFPTTLVRERTLRELRQLRTVSAPQVARVLGAGKLDGGGVYEVCEVVAGDMLDVSIARPSAEVAAIMGVIGDALIAAQKVGIIHRNLGANVIHQSASGLKVGGFAVGEPQGDKGAGSLDTISPEQAQGKVVDQRSLIYNLAALTQQLLTGKPLFEGTADDRLRAHVASEAQGVAYEPLRRALAKEPRTRPMMLRQFLRELAALDGPARDPVGASASAAPPITAQQQPSTRGWTMFMEEDGNAEAAQEAGAGTVREPSSDAPTSPEPRVDPPDTVPRPSTRGWTMFMDAGEENETPARDDGGSSSEPAPIRKPVSSGPSTRGWTMFMDDDGTPAESPDVSEAPGASDVPGGAAQPSPATTTGLPAQTPRVQLSVHVAHDETAAPPASAAEKSTAGGDLRAGGAGKPSPSTRGWTMFMQEDGSDVSASPAPPVEPEIPTRAPPQAEPAAPLASPPAAASPVSPVSPSVAAPASPPKPLRPSVGSPATRGWTMFMDAKLPTDGTGSESDPTAPDTSAEPTIPLTPSAVEVSAPGARGGDGRAADVAAAELRDRSAADSPRAAASAAARGWVAYQDTPVASVESGVPVPQAKVGQTVMAPGGSPPGQLAVPSLADPSPGVAQASHSVARADDHRRSAAVHGGDPKPPSDGLVRSPAGETSVVTARRPGLPAVDAALGGHGGGSADAPPSPVRISTASLIIASSGRNTRTVVGVAVALAVIVAYWVFF